MSGPARCRHAFGLALGLLFLGGPALSRADAARQPNVTRYDLEIRPDFAARKLHVRAVLRIENPGLDSTLWFSLGSAYSARVREEGHELTMTRQGSGLGVAMTNPRKTHQLEFEIEGSHPRSEDERRDVIGSHDLFLLWSDKFYPVSFEDWATVRTTIVLPPRFQAVAPGRLVRTRRGARDVVYVFETTHPTRLFSVFADDRWIRSERQVGGVRMQTFLHPGSEQFSDQIFRSSGDVIGFYRNLFGTYDFDGFRFITLDSIYARRAFPGFVGYNPEYLAKEMARTGHDAHETALIWWGYTLAGTGPGSFQWTEGFGDYAEALYDEARGLPLSHNLKRARDDYLASQDSDVPYTELRGSTPQKFVHGKLPWLMHLIRFVNGDEAFRRAMRTLFAKYRERTFTIEEFIRTLEEGLHAQLDWWRTEWLERQGVPELRAEATIDSSEGRYRLSCRVTQVGRVVHVPMELEIETARSRRVERLRLIDSSLVWSCDLPDRPVRVQLDPNRWILARMSREPLVGAPIRKGE